MCVHPTQNVNNGSKEFDQDGEEDDNISRRVRLVHPATRLTQNQRQTLVVLRRRHDNQTAVQ